MLYALALYWIVCSGVLVYLYFKDKGIKLIPTEYMLAFLILGGGALAPWMGLAFILEILDKKTGEKRDPNYYVESSTQLLIGVFFVIVLVGLEVTGVQAAKAQEEHERALSAECSSGHRPYSCELPDYLLK
jgi:hypothetical protein